MENIPSVPDFLSQKEWDFIVGLGTLPAFEGIAASFEQYGDDWRAWYMEQEPEVLPFPGEWSRKCSNLQSMILIRCLRPDRVLNTIRRYVSSVLSPEFTVPPAPDLNAALLDSDAYTPILFILSPGVDPLHELRRLADTNKIPEDSFHDLALGQGQAEAAKSLLTEGSEKGWWIYFGNCHLMISWMDSFEAIFEEISLTQINPKFRLWLSSDPHPKFPISILQKSVKITTESPNGIRANMQSLFSSMPPDTIDKNTPQIRTLIFTLCFLHSVIIERRKFLTLGWNIPYAFNSSDFDISTKVIVKLLDNPAKPISWDALRFLVSDIHYGGRVTDEWDQRLLNVYVKQYFNSETINTPNYPLSTHTSYYVPDVGLFKNYLEFVDKMLSIDPPEAFGQHPNADFLL